MSNTRLYYICAARKVNLYLESVRLGMGWQHTFLFAFQAPDSLLIY